MTGKIYLDNAATTYPKPREVVEAMVWFMEDAAANPGRSRHDMSIKAEEVIENTRISLAGLFNAPDPRRIVFTLNATESLNAVIYGSIPEGGHVIMTALEHNSVIRPLRDLESRGLISLSVLNCDKMGFLKLDDLPGMIRENTSLVCVNHASNVCGTIQDIDKIRAIIGDIPLMVDAAQTAGSRPIDVQALEIDYLAFSGHKGLYGPQGTGGLYIREGARINPLKRGGTGSVSENETQPEFFPDAMESGTRNNVGLAGLGAGVDFVMSKGLDAIRAHECELLERFIDKTLGVAGLTLYGPLKPEKQTPILSMTFDGALPEGLSHTIGGCGGRAIPATFESVHPHEAGAALKDEFEILVRVGLHCAPLAHKALGTFPDGTVRFSMGYFNTIEEIDIAAEAVIKIAEKFD